ncbi:hypothetical protein F5Y10DRAFT_286031 [Nemania abortiva]|nr:hypothetical protein F5Y10DRAFT_286031 [Nemania abortiva]
MPDNPSYIIQDVPGKGKGLVATEKIARGTRILCEEPIVTVPREKAHLRRLQAAIAQQVEALEPSLRQAFLSMCNLYPHDNSVEKLYWGIFKTNSLPVEVGEIDSAIFLEACRINHACDRNAQHQWNNNIKKHTVHALRDIEKGDEITICYLGVDKSRDARIKALQDNFNFVCSCRLCSLPLEQSRESDRRLDRLCQLDDLIHREGYEGILRSPLQYLRLVDEQVRLYNEQGPNDCGLARAFFDAARVAITNGDLARGRVFAERAVSEWRHGHLTDDPARFELHGWSAKWKTAVNDVPSKLEPDAFEDWLWKRYVPQREGHPADIRNRSCFPGFRELPGDYDDNGWGLIQTQQDAVYVSHPLGRHWCFLAEILDHSLFLRLHMAIKDMDGEELSLFFHTEGRGYELASADICKGHTIAILDAQRHAFKFSDPGIRLENSRLMKIFPVSFRNLLEINDLIQRFSAQVDGLRTCHGCEKKAASLQACAKCHLFWYCHKECQTTGWKEKNHKASCIALRDPDLRGLFNGRWIDTGDTVVEFPLRLT